MTASILFAAFILLVVLVVWVIHSTSEGKRKRWAEVADALGLVVERRAAKGHALPWIVGDRDGQPVRLGVLASRGRYTPERTYVEATLPRSLALGLIVSQRGTFGSGPLPFDELYGIVGSPLERAHALVAVPELHEA